eukprot:5014733-Pleurochrysis_carterae.AAC.1
MAGLFVLRVVATRASGQPPPQCCSVPRRALVSPCAPHWRHVRQRRHIVHAPPPACRSHSPPSPAGHDRGCTVVTRQRKLQRVRRVH